MSQLYQLFCEGLKTRSEVLSSTLILTSTPLEDEDGDQGFVAKPSKLCQPLAQHSAGINPCGSQTDQVQENSSVQGQVGSANTESPPADEGGVSSPADAGRPRPGAGPGPGPGPGPDGPILSKGANEETSCSREVLQRDGIVEALTEPAEVSAHPSTHLKERNWNVSAVDFVDRWLALKRRDEALGTNKRRNSRSSTSSDESQPQDSEPRPKSPRKSVEPSDSSETDFEGAAEYYQKHRTPTAPMPPNPVESERSPKTSNPSNVNLKKTPPKKSSLSSRKSSDGSNINLFIDSLTSSSSVDVSEHFDENGLPYVSAARCRIFSKPPKQTPKTPEPQCKPSQEDKLETSRLKNAHVVLTNSQATNKVCHLTKNATNSKLSTLLKGVTAYVEVRSGHDNRSMGVRTQLRALGARVLEKFSKEVTHVIFNEGSPGTLKRAQGQGCHLVSVLWIEECKTSGQIAPEADHPPLNLHLYSASSKYRKMKSFQPDFEEGKSEERLNKYVKKFRAQSQKAASSQQAKEVASHEESSEGESSDEDATGKQPEHILPKGVCLKNLSIVLKRIDAVDLSGVSDKRNRRKLMPLTQQPELNLTLEDFDPAERFRPEFPYSSEPKPRRIVKQKSSASQNFRRKSSCFVRGTQGFAGSQKKAKPQMRTMVCTFMHRRDIDVVAAVIKKLGGWILEPTVSLKTTHVVCGDSKRTINLLRGIAHGCWILHQEWVMRSLEAGYWLDEEPFELTVFPAIQQSRVARETLGVCPDIFSSAGAIFVAQETTPPRSDILDLLELCGALIVKSARQAKVIIGHYQRRTSHTDVILVKEQWVLDSIQENMLQPFRRYRL